MRVLCVIKIRNECLKGSIKNTGNGLKEKRLDLTVKIKPISIAGKDTIYLKR